MDRTQTIQYVTDKMKNQEPFAYLKMGDDCMFCMKGQQGANAEQHPYSSELGIHLREAHRYMLTQPNVIVTEWGDDNFDSLLLHEDSYLTEDLKEFYRTLKHDPRKKYYFAQERMRPAAEFFNMEFVPVPFPDSYSHFKQVKKEIQKIMDNNIIILFSCGMLSKVMVYECWKACPYMTAIDLGSAFDPLFVGSTRSHDPDQHLRVKEYFKDL